MRTLRAADAINTPGLSESLALAVDTQYLLVPWDFVSNAWVARSGSKFFVDNPNQEAHLVELDMVSNLALLKVEQPLIPSFYRGSLRIEPPTQDETLVTMGSRELVRPGARFVRAKNEGALVRYQMALGASELGPAHFVFDRGGRLVGVASGSESKDRVWAGSARSVFDMLRRQDGPKPASANVNGTALRRGQLYGWQNRWAQLVAPQKGAWSMQTLDCQNHSVSVAEQSLAVQIRKTRATNCVNRFPLTLGSGYSTGVEVVSGEVQLATADAEAGAKAAHALGSELFADLDKSASFVNLLTVPDCKENKIVNRQGQTVQVKFCTSALKPEPGLNDTAVAVSTVEAGSRAYVAVARFKGFDQANTRRLIEGMIENVRSFR